MSPVATEEKDLIAALHGEKHQTARNELVEKYQPLVRYIANKHAVNAEYLDELIQIGSIGLIKAIDRFDPSKGVKISTYATYRIKGEIKDYFRNSEHRLLRPSRQLHELAVKLENARQTLTSTHHKPTITELAEFVGVSTKKAETALSLQVSALSLDDIGQDESSGQTLTDILGKEDGAFSQLEYSMTLDFLNCSALSQRELRVLHLRFYEDQSPTEIAKLLGCSQSNITLIIKKAFIKLLGSTNRSLNSVLPAFSLASSDLSLTESEKALAQEAVNALDYLGNESKTDVLVQELHARRISLEALLFALRAKYVKFISNGGNGTWRVLQPTLTPSSFHKMFADDLAFMDRLLLTLLKHGNGGMERRILRETLRNQPGSLRLPEYVVFAQLLGDTARRGFVEVQGSANSDLVIPLITLSDIFEKYRKRALNQERQAQQKRLLKPSINDPRFEQLLAQPLSSIARFMTVLLQFGSNGTTRRNLRKILSQKSNGSSFDMRDFTRTVYKAQDKDNCFEKSLIEVIPAKNQAEEVFRPLIRLDDLIEKLPKTKANHNQHKATCDNNPLFDELAQMPLSRPEKVLVVLWQFGPEGTDRKTLRETIKNEVSNLQVSSHHFSYALYMAVHNNNRWGQLVEIRDALTPDEQVIYPLVTLENLCVKYQLPKGGVGE